MKNFLFFISGLFLLAACCVLIFFLYIFAIPVISEDKGTIFYIPPGSTQKQFVSNLTQIGLVKSPAIFSLYIHFQKNVQLKTGEYLFPKGSTLNSIWKQVTLGKGFFYRQFTIIPGWSFAQLRRELLKIESLRHLILKLTDQQIMQYLGNKDFHPEGQFYPETYNYTKNIQDLVILKRAYNLMQIKLKEDWKNRDGGLPYKTPYEALIAASLIEKEAYLQSERPIIAGVLVNRLKKDMLLQFDPTVIYGLGENFHGKIKKENLLKNTVYNTYIHKGLPPTPIAMPSHDSIQAALHPQKNNYYYFVAKGDGSHQFSKSLGEHQSAIERAHQQQNNNVPTSLVHEENKSSTVLPSPTTTGK